MEDYGKYDNGQLKAYLRYTQIDIDAAQKRLQECEDKANSIQAELRRREIDAFFDANEGLRLAVGDKLLVTDDYIEWNEPSRLIVQSTKETIGTVYTITKLAFMKDAICIDIHTDKKWLGWIDLPIARRMRLAWLASVQEAQP